MNDKKKAEAFAARAAGGSDVDEPMAMGDHEEVGPNGDIEMDDGKIVEVDANEMQVRLGGEGDYDDQENAPPNGAEMAGHKRPKREFSEEGEDMDFEAIQ